MRACPRCTYPLAQFNHGEVELDHCHRCGGTFLDPGEANLLFGTHAEPTSFVEGHRTESLGKAKIKCPDGHGAFSAYSVQVKKKKVEVDVCDSCGGMWLDAKEGNQLYEVVAEADDERVRRQDGVDKPSYLFQLLTQFPVEVWHPTRRPAVWTKRLVWVIIACFVVQMFLLVAAPWSLGYYAMVPSKVLAGERLWTLLTNTFAHGGIMHIVGNLYFLWVFGDNVEDYAGPKRFLALYFLSALAADLLHLFTNFDSSVPCLGASGAISGLMGAYIVLFPKVEVYAMLLVFRLRVKAFWYLGIWIGLQFYSAYSGEGGTAWYAHIGGFLLGVVFALWLRRKGPAH